MTANPHSAKKPYEKPVLRLYGDIQALTNSVNHNLKGADGSPNKS